VSGARRKNNALTTPWYGSRTVGNRAARPASATSRSSAGGSVDTTRSASTVSLPGRVILARVAVVEMPRTGVPVRTVPPPASIEARKASTTVL
jgi:hypothetical protein